VVSLIALELHVVGAESFQSPWLLEVADRVDTMPGKRPTNRCFPQKYALARIARSASLPF